MPKVRELFHDATTVKAKRWIAIYGDRSAMQITVKRSEKGRLQHVTQAEVRDLLGMGPSVQLVPLNSRFEVIPDPQVPNA